MVKKATAKVVGHPPYADMIKEAIVTLKERGGSSLVALKKFMGQKFKLPIGWEKKLSLFLKKMTMEGKLIKVKGSWKLGLPEKKAAVKPKKVVAVKPKAKGKVATVKKGVAAAGKKLKKVTAAKKAAVVKKRGVVKPKPKATTKKTAKSPKSVAKPVKKAKAPAKKKGAAPKKN